MMQNDALLTNKWAYGCR